MTDLHHGAVIGEGATLFADSQAEVAQAITNRRIFLQAWPDNSVIATLFAQEKSVPIGTVERNLIIFTHDRSRSGAVALHNVTATMEAELIASSTPGIWHRSTLRYLAFWIFCENPVRRLVCRIPANQPKLQDYARRLGFTLEGRARHYFTDDIDATVWVMFANTCPWLKG
ncbi:MAG: hypothetical protein J0I42_20220 [Bosea sp.]|uniref:hypothetical protein n=1 Tax=Bosea sp. (in: a-proteobacteria) TaxID=1871050 RepID=UPI001AC9E4FB|nr:hypothetical protein [Bosea sp. (in: a-proteobacteria)]MBN9454269.1 hypothetical protein [Bosea sp. (in: a-proteobacteria)]